jgi:hypothetical protein
LSPIEIGGADYFRVADDPRISDIHPSAASREPNWVPRRGTG